jgi:hypothetical protein
VYSSEDDCYGTPTRGGHGILRSLSNVITLNLRAHYGQVLFMSLILWPSRFLMLSAVYDYMHGKGLQT